MKSILLITLLAAPALSLAQAKVTQGSVETVVDNNKGFIRIEGPSAKMLFDSMTQVEGKNNMGEAGPNLYFKDGKNVSCFMDLEMDPDTDGAYACSLTIEDASTGKIGKQ
jgi:hypothetical protein